MASFTFHHYPILTPEQQSPINALISRAMQGYGKGMDLAYKPREKEANIFSKEIGPLAALASNPNFTGFNPEVQKMISQKIGNYLGGNHNNVESDQNNSSQTTPGYAGDVDIFNRLKKGADVALSTGGQRKVGQSRLAGQAEKLGLPDFISHALGGSKAAGENAAFEQAIDEGAQRLRLKGYPENRIEQMLRPMPGEKKEAYIKRIQPLFIGENNQSSQEAPPHSVDEKIARDEQERAQYEKGIDSTKSAKGESVLMETPDGKQWFVPVDKVKDAKKMHAKEVK